jgi:poly(beta-D-mannuronate) lyase
MRIGDSKTSLQAGRVTVQRNVFEKCNGEIEVISNKSCENLYQSNTFVDCHGQLTLRHGNNCIVRDNVFLGAGHALNSGIRIIGQGHIVEGNHLEKLGGEQFYGAIVMCNGVQNGALHTYGPVRDCVVRNNLIIACRSPFDIGVHSASGNAHVAPMDCTIEINTIIDPSGLAVIHFRTEKQGQLTWRGNRITGMDLNQKLIIGNEVPLSDDAFSLLKDDPAKLRDASLARLKPLDRSDVGAVWAR